MNCAQVFSYALRLKGAERAEKILALLDEKKLEEVKECLQVLDGMTLAGIRQLWREQRMIEERAQMQAMVQRFGAEEAEMHPALAKWLAQKR